MKGLGPVRPRNKSRSRTRLNSVDIWHQRGGHGWERVGVGLVRGRHPWVVPGQWVTRPTALTMVAGLAVGTGWLSPSARAVAGAQGTSYITGAGTFRASFHGKPTVQVQEGPSQAFTMASPWAHGPVVSVNYGRSSGPITVEVRGEQVNALAATIDGPPSGPSPYCLEDEVAYRVVFRPSPGAPPSYEAVGHGCEAVVTVSEDGRSLVPRQDAHYALFDAVAKLLPASAAGTLDGDPECSAPAT
jgi:hypothetical protein